MRREWEKYVFLDKTSHKISPKTSRKTYIAVFWYWHQNYPQNKPQNEYNCHNDRYIDILVLAPKLAPKTSTKMNIMVIMADILVFWCWHQNQNEHQNYPQNIICEIKSYICIFRCWNIGMFDKLHLYSFGDKITIMVILSYISIFWCLHQN